MDKQMTMHDWAMSPQKTFSVLEEDPRRLELHVLLTRAMQLAHELQVPACASVVYGVKRVEGDEVIERGEYMLLPYDHGRIPTQFMLQTCAECAHNLDHMRELVKHLSVAQTLRNELLKSQQAEAEVDEERS